LSAISAFHEEKSPEAVNVDSGNRDRVVPRGPAPMRVQPSLIVLLNHQRRPLTMTRVNLMIAPIDLSSTSKRQSFKLSVKGDGKHGRAEPVRLALRAQVVQSAIRAACPPDAGASTLRRAAARGAMR
jgi:ribosomal protein S9